MTSVAGVNRANAALGRAGDEHRQIVINRAAFGAAVFGKANLARAAGTPLESARLQVEHGLKRGLLDPAGQLFRVTVNALLMRCGDRLAKQRRRNAREHWRGVGVRGGDGEALRCEAGFFLQPLGHGLHQRPRHAEVVHSDDHRRAGLTVVDRQCLGPNFLGDALRLGPAKAKPAQPHREPRRDIDRGRPDAPLRVGFGRHERDEQQNGNERKRFHAGPEYGDHCAGCKPSLGQGRFFD